MRCPYPPQKSFYQHSLGKLNDYDDAYDDAHDDTYEEVPFDDIYDGDPEIFGWANYETGEY